MKEKRIKPNDLMKGALAKAYNVPEKDIYFEKSKRKRQSKSRKNKKNIDKEKVNDIIVDNNEGLALVGIHPKLIEFNEIEKPRRTGMNWDKSITQWNSADVYHFAYYLYREKYKDENYWDLRQPRAQIEILRLKGALKDEFGDFNWILMRDYIIYFFDKHIDFFRRRQKDGLFFFSQLLHKSVIRSFAKTYDIKKSCEAYDRLEEKTQNPSLLLRNKDLEKSYILSESSLVGNFGVIVPINWLIIVKHNTVEEAIEIVKNGCRKMFHKKAFDSVIETTRKYSPYPKWLPYKDANAIISSIVPDKEIEIEFKDSVKNKSRFYERLKKINGQRI